MNAQQFTLQVSSLKFDCTFNPYSDHCEIHDTRNASQIRFNTLLNVLHQACSGGVDALWIGRDLGYRGGRRTGLAFTDDFHFNTHVARWGLNAVRPTRGDKVGERSATYLWQALNLTQHRVFLWNLFPLHPHQESKPFTNRAHNAQERKVGTQLVAELIDMIQPRYLVPIGRDATKALENIAGTRCVLPVRHPSYGGQRIFLEQITNLHVTGNV